MQVRGQGCIVNPILADLHNSLCLNLRKNPYPNPRQGQSVTVHSSWQNPGQFLALPPTPKNPQAAPF